MKVRRDVSIVFLRFVALTCIVIAHINPSPLIFQLRNFDVPLMVFLSGVSFRISGGNNDGYWHYALKRFKRLILPVWVFLAVYYSIVWIKDGEMLLLTTMVSYYTLITPWFVWIIRVFFVIALIASLVTGTLINFNKWAFLFWSAALLVVFEVFCMSGYSQFRFSEYVLMNIPYLIVFALGVKIKEFKAKEVVGISAICLSLFFGLLINYKLWGGVFLSTQLFKYPPRIYYLSYSIFCSLILWIVKDNLTFFIGKISARISGYMAYIGSHTIWIYLWHIVALQFCGIIESAFGRFAIVYLVAISITVCQVKLIEMVTDNMNNNTLMKNIRMIFIG